MDLDDLTPVGGSSLRGPAAPAVREPVATFTLTRAVHPDEIWSPRGSEIASPQRPLSPAPGHGFEHEPVNRAERDAQQTAQNAGQSLADHAASIRATLRPGKTSG
jgi:hypothetical protein